MSDIFAKHLNKLSEIKPDEEFKARSRALVLAAAMPKMTSPRRFTLSEIMTRSRVFGIAAVAALLLVIGGAFGLNGMRDGAVLALDESNISDELATLSIDLRLDQVSYNQRIQETVAMAVTEITTRQVQNVEPVVSAESEAILPGVFDRNEKIDDLLREVIF